MDINIEIVKTRVDAKSRKLKAQWTIDYDSGLNGLRLPGNELSLIEPDASDTGYPYGVDCSDVNFSRLRKIEQWALGTFRKEDYLIAGPHREFLWFAEDKHRTLLLMKWS